jgi:hypothetical protein
MMRDWHAEVMHPDLSTPDGQRAMLTARYRHAALTFTAPPQSESGLFEASWDGAQVEADSEDELLRLVLEELQDCGTEAHDWVAVSQAPDPLNTGITLLTQRLQCVYCDSRVRVITVPAYAPGATADECALMPCAAGSPACAASPGSTSDDH